MTKTVATSDDPPLIDRRRNSCGDDRPFRCEAQRHEPPDCDQELARQGDNRDAAGSTVKRANTVPEPCREAALWLVPKPKPSELDERFAGSAVAGALDAPIAIHAAALKRSDPPALASSSLTCSDVARTGDLPAILNTPIRPFGRIGKT
jgi:hypothetical protein